MLARAVEVPPVKRVLLARALVVGLQLVLIGIAVLIAAAAAPRWNITPLPHLKNAPLTASDLATVLPVFLGYHLAGYLLSLAVLRAPAFGDARRALAELYVLMAATSLASCHLFLLTVVPFSANFHAFVYLLGPTLHALAFAGFAAARRQPARPLVERLRALPGRVRPLVLSRWTAVTCAVALGPGALAVLYKKNGDFANLVNLVRVSLNHGGDSRWTLVDALPAVAFDQPMDLRFSPADPTQLFVLERPGRLVRVDLGAGAPRREVLLDFVDEVGAAQIECGALSFALHPEFGRPGSPNAGHVYVYYTRFAGDVQRNRLARFDLSRPGVAARTASRLLLVDQGRAANGFHNGGSVRFDEEGFLYWSCGDTAARRAQRLDDALTGGIFRIDVDRRGGDLSGPILRQPNDGVTANYFIPRTNPWAGSPDALGEFVVLGLRNPFRFSLDGETLWVGDVGWDGQEEITRIERGGNAQWPFREGDAPTVYPRPDEVVGFETGPFYAYAQTAVDRAVIGGLVYRGERYPDLRGKYVYADNNSGIVRALDPARQAAAPVVVARAPFLGQQGITSLEVAPDGSLLITALGGRSAPSGAVLRLAPADEAVAALAAPRPGPGPAAAKYEAVCARCHGLDGKGEPALDGQGGMAPRPDFTDPAWQARTSDEQIRRIVLEGGAALGRSRDMPAWRGFFDEDELDDLVRKIRAFGR